jgi:hypothetical protein
MEPGKTVTLTPTRIFGRAWCRNKESSPVHQRGGGRGNKPTNIMGL